MNRELKAYLIQAMGLLRRRQKRSEDANEQELLRMLEELMKEQVPNEDLDSSARPSR